MTTTRYFDKWSHIFPHLKTLPYPQPGDFVLFYFQHKDNGIFMDVGAHDGIQMSNTVNMEVEKGWKGACFEPHPKVFQELQKNRSCGCFPYAVSNNNGPQDFLVCTGYTEMLSGLDANYEPHHKQRMNREIGQFGGSVEKIQVLTTTLQNALDQWNTKYVDYLSIDTEGSEMAVLQGIDFSRTYIKLISCEDNRGQEVEEFLKTKGYKKLIKVCGDSFYERWDV